MKSLSLSIFYLTLKCLLVTVYQSTIHQKVSLSNCVHLEMDPFVISWFPLSRVLLFLIDSVFLRQHVSALIGHSNMSMLSLGIKIQSGYLDGNWFLPKSLAAERYRTIWLVNSDMYKIHSQSMNVNDSFCWSQNKKKEFQLFRVRYKFNKTPVYSTIDKT